MDLGGNMKKYTLQIIIGILIFINIISLSYITKLNKKIDINNDYINGLSGELNWLLRTEIQKKLKMLKVYLIMIEI